MIWQASDMSPIDTAFLIHFSLLVYTKLPRWKNISTISFSLNKWYIIKPTAAFQLHQSCTFATHQCFAVVKIVAILNYIDVSTLIFIQDNINAIATIPVSFQQHTHTSYSECSTSLCSRRNSFSVHKTDKQRQFTAVKWLVKKKMTYYTNYKLLVGGSRRK